MTVRKACSRKVTGAGSNRVPGGGKDARAQKGDNIMKEERRKCPFNGRRGQRLKTRGGGKEEKSGSRCIMQDFVCGISAGPWPRKKGQERIQRGRTRGRNKADLNHDKVG